MPSFISRLTFKPIPFTDVDKPPTKFGPFQTRQVPNELIVVQNKTKSKDTVLKPQTSFSIVEN